MAQALYRKYRSKSLGEIVGQQHITDILSRALKNGHINHAYLLTGPRGVGKTSIARILAHEINKIPYSSNMNLDIIEIDAASNNGVEDVRDLREKVTIAPVSADKKVYIIDEVHMLSKPAFNALLKTLEEPPEHVVFILATTEVHKLPDTILSRTQRFHFRPIATDEMTQHLAVIAKKEKIKIDKKALTLIAQRSGGSFRDGISILDQIRSISDETITADTIEQALGLAPAESVIELVDHILQHHMEKAIHTIDQLEQQGISPVVLSDQLTQYLRSQIATHTELIPLIDELIEIGRSYDPQLKLLSIVAKHSSSEKPKHVALTSKDTTITIEPPTQTLKKATQPVEPKPATPVQTKKKKTAAAFKWDELLNDLRTENPPLYGIMQKAIVVGDQDMISITFGFKLHQKKLDQGKYRDMLTEFLHKKLGVVPTISTSVDKLPTADKGISSITAIMGGGEEVNVSQA